jgi:hypothetical protein
MLSPKRFTCFHISQGTEKTDFTLLTATMVRHLAGWTERGIGYSSLIDKKMGAVISKDLKSWEDISDKITFPDGVRHGTIFSSDVKILQNLLSNGQIR